MLLKTREQCICPRCGLRCFMVLERTDQAGIKFCDTCHAPIGLTDTAAEQARSAITEAVRSDEVKSE